MARASISGHSFRVFAEARLPSPNTTAQCVGDPSPDRTGRDLDVDHRPRKGRLRRARLFPEGSAAVGRYLRLLVVSSRGLYKCSMIHTCLRVCARARARVTV